MKNARNNDLSDRRIAAAQAKTALLNAYRAAKAADEPARLARQAERNAIVAATEERRRERERVKRDEAERRATEAAERQATADAAARAETEAREAARKAERDRRYATRKARRA